MEYQRIFKQSLKESRTLNDTTFLMEELTTTDEVHGKEWSENADLYYDKYGIAPDGGCVVVYHDRFAGDDVKKLHIYDSYLNLIKIIELKQDGNPQKIFVTQEECIVVVFGNGTVATYNMRGVCLSQNVEYECGSIDVSFAAFWSHGVYVVSSNRSVYVYDDFVSLKPKLFCKWAGNTLMGGVAVPANPVTGVMGHLWAYDSDGQLALIQENDYEFQDFYSADIGPIKGITFSPDYDIACVYTESHYLFCEPDMSKVILHNEYDEVEPKSVVWCGSDTVLLMCNKFIVMTGACSEAIRWDYTSSVGAVSEIDGARVFTTNNVFLLRSIPPVPHDFALWNTKCPAVHLFIEILDEEQLAIHDAIDEFNMDQLTEAINGLYDAAIFFTKFEQRSPLLTAISRAINMTKEPKEDGSEDDEKLIRIRDFEGFADRLQTLRCIQTVSRDPYNIPMSYQQFTHVTSPVLLKRICNRSLHIEAFRIAYYLRVSTELIAAHWANCLVNTKLDIEDITKRLAAMTEPIDYIDLATTAFNIGNKPLAVALLAANPAKARGVPLLIDRGQWDEALNAAIDSSDTSLIVFALNKARDEEQDDPLEAILKSSEIARGTFLCVADDEIREEIYEICGDPPFVKLQKATYNEDAKEAELYRKEVRDAKDQLHLETYNFYKNLFKHKKDLEANGYECKEGEPQTVFATIDKMLEKNAIKDAYSISKLMGMDKEDLAFRWLRIGVKLDNLDIIQKIYKEYKPDFVKEQLIPFCEKKLKHADGVKVLMGQDPLVVRPPPEEEENKKKKGRRSRKKEEEERKKKEAEEAAKKEAEGEKKEGEEGAEGEKKEGEEGEKKEGEGEEKKDEAPKEEAKEEAPKEEAPKEEAKEEAPKEEEKKE
ncbi:hypothetical protein TVAG_288630 [Trichomonas vaginalis G3]|uniref:Vps16 N-terminal domain-containing protein n=1 Tax=Trichomonas vaginalis (strain ATCC PRA-98 / G3) TaxID=412133 RepID=A2FEC2_TRIV3|nr:vacuolar protein sorting VPSs16 family [Trichomonas vaginalis G3]EAX96762.1 hypothetical protein TVAG_288630 [Trichomonas vaginalis G3]KAI5520158.1 vacuolar protein sorting VPSs16 family [Trichomonas vaginalis G3]|eukprot:XP_001309692.1 hypothetical protein [Trichomonas vaginalis G3]